MSSPLATLLRGGPRFRVEEQSDCRADRRERCAQLVGDGGEEVASEALEFGQMRPQLAALNDRAGRHLITERRSDVARRCARLADANDAEGDELVQQLIGSPGLKPGSLVGETIGEL